MTPLGVGTLVPADRLSASGSRLVADQLFGAGLLAAIVATALLSLFYASRARRLAAAVWRERGLQRGPILLAGVAEPAERDPGRSVDAIRPFVELTIVQQGKQRGRGQKSTVEWREVERSLRDEPFVLRTERGDRVRVEADGRIDLVDALERPVRHGDARRRRVARIVAGESIWARGVLSQTRTPGDGGPYRGGSGAWTLRPPAGRPLLISSEPVEREDTAVGMLHARFAAAYLVFLLIAQILLFRTYHLLRAEGVPTEGTVLGSREYTVRKKNRVEHHYVLRLSFATAGGPVEGELESGRAGMELPVGARVPLVYAPGRPSTAQLGAPADVGLTRERASLASVLVGGALVLHLATLVGRRPWWRRRRVIETEAGPL